jgi:hypothetical protein
MVRILSPEGRIGVAPHQLAPLPGPLSALRLGVLDNGKPNARLLLTRMAERLGQRTGSQLAVVTGKGTAATPAEADVLERLAKDVDVVLTGSAD